MTKQKLAASVLMVLSISSFSASRAQITSPAPGSNGNVAESDSAAIPALRGTMTVPVAVEPISSDLDRSLGQQWHRATLHLSGSMCPACLLELEGKLKQLPGVAFAKIDREVTPAAPGGGDSKEQNTSGEAANASSSSPVQPGAHMAATVIIYDSRLVTFDRLQHCIRDEKYKPIDQNDVIFQEQPKAQ